MTYQELSKNVYIDRISSVDFYVPRNIDTYVDDFSKPRTALKNAKYCLIF